MQVLVELEALINNDPNVSERHATHLCKFPKIGGDWFADFLQSFWWQ
jgi:hypothetical protein